MTDLLAMKPNITTAFDFVQSRLFLEKTGLIYDHVISGRESEFPTAAECRAAFPNPCGYSTGMEDGMINGATMLDACLLRYEKEQDDCAARFAQKLVEGMLRCAEAADSEGFLPRAVSPEDGQSHYPDSSRDQYTMFAFGMHRYLNSPLCRADLRQRIAQIALAIARRAQRNVTQANGYDLLTDDGRATLVNTLWGDAMGNHETLRLPMLYLLAYEAVGDPHWLECYRALRETALQQSLPMGRYWALYTLQQMQVSILLCRDVDPDAEWKERYLKLMHQVADYAEAQVPSVRRKISAIENCNSPQPSFRDLPMTAQARFAALGYNEALYPERPDGKDFFTLQDGAQIAIITGLVPHRAPLAPTLALLRQTFEKIDLRTHERNLPLYFLDGYYRSIPPVDDSLKR